MVYQNDRNVAFYRLATKVTFLRTGKIIFNVRMATKSMASYIITNLNILLSVSWPELQLYPMKQKSIYISSFHALKSKSATAAAGHNKIGFKKSPLCFSKYHQSICNLWPIQKFCQNILWRLQHHHLSHTINVSFPFREGEYFVIGSFVLQ